MAQILHLLGTKCNNEHFQEVFRQLLLRMWTVAEQA